MGDHPGPEHAAHTATATTPWEATLATSERAGPGRTRPPAPPRTHAGRGYVRWDALSRSLNIKNAFSKSREADNSLGFTANVDKFQLSATTSAQRKILAATMGDDTPAPAATFKLLGVVFSSGKTRSGPTTRVVPERIKKVRDRLIRIHQATNVSHRRATLVESMAFTIISWCGTMARISDTQLRTTNTLAGRKVLGEQGNGASSYAKTHIAMGWKYDIRAHLLKRSIEMVRAHLRKRIIQKTWETRLHSGRFLSLDPWRAATLAQSMAAQVGWTLNGQEIHGPMGTLDLTRDGKTRIEAWANTAIERLAYRRDNRLARNPPEVELRASDPGIARSLDLPPPRRTE